MARPSALLVLAVLVPAGGSPAQVTPTVMSICELAKDLPSYDDKLVSVRGVYYYGLRQECLPKCTQGAWPSFIWLTGGGNWDDLDKAERKLEIDAKRTGKRFELRVTVTGHLHTKIKPSPLAPCVTTWPGYGHFSQYPAEIVVDRFTDIDAKANPQSPYDYSYIYRGPL